jgi:hypothetical protein
LALVALAVLVLAAMLIFQKPDNSEMIRLEAERDRALRNIDSLEYSLSKTRDSLEIAFYTIRIAKAEVYIARQETIKFKKQYEAVKFIPYRNDAERDSVLAELYPSFRSVR